MAIFSSLRADALNQAGMKLRDAGDDDGANVKYRQALALDPQRANTLYNLGLVYKYRRAWRESFECNQTANVIRPGDEATLWNLAIAATALRDWHTARDVWRDLKIYLKAGEGAIDANFGTIPVRLYADTTTGCRPDDHRLDRCDRTVPTVHRCHRAAAVYRIVWDFIDTGAQFDGDGHRLRSDRGLLCARSRVLGERCRAQDRRRS